MKFSILPLSLYQDIYDGKLTLPVFAAKAAAMGYDAIDINEYMLQGKTDEEIVSLRRSLSLPVLCMCIYSDFTTSDQEKLNQELARAKDNIRRASLLDCRYVRITAGPAYPEVISKVAEDQSLDQVIRCFEECCRLAEEVSKERVFSGLPAIHLLIENHLKALSWDYLDYNFDLERLEKLWEKMQGLPIAFNYDTANAFALGNWKKVLSLALERIEALHINDIKQLNPFACAIAGEGIVCIEDMLHEIFDFGFDGWITIEEASFIGEDGARKAITNLKNICERICHE